MHTRLVVPPTAQLSEKGALSEDTAQNYFRQIVSAVSYCHEKLREDMLHMDSVTHASYDHFRFHGDLSLENILLAKDGACRRPTSHHVNIPAMHSLRLNISSCDSEYPGYLRVRHLIQTSPHSSTPKPSGWGS